VVLLLLLIVEEKLKEEELVKLLEEDIVVVGRGLVWLLLGLFEDLVVFGVRGESFERDWNSDVSMGNATGALISCWWDCATCTMDGAGMFTIPGVMSFRGTAPLLNLLFAPCLRHCGNSLIVQSRDVS